MVLEPPRTKPASSPVADLSRRPSGKDEFNASAVAVRIYGSAQTGFRDGGHELNFSALGTTCRIVVAGTAPAATAFFGAALEWVIAFEAKYSRFLPDSLVSRINRAAGAGWVELDAGAERIFGLCHELNFLTRRTRHATRHSRFRFA